MQQKPMIILTGPTAVGKSALSVELAKKINGAKDFYSSRCVHLNTRRFFRNLKFRFILPQFPTENLPHILRENQ